MHHISLALSQMADEIREINTKLGWRVPEGGPGNNTFGDYIALAHSELSEALEAYRDYRLEDATEVHMFINDGGGRCANCEQLRGSCTVRKPEGVGSEFADVLIRLIDMADIFGIDLAQEYHRKMAYNRTRPFRHGGRTLADS